MVLNSASVLSVGIRQILYQLIYLVMFCLLIIHVQLIVIFAHTAPIYGALAFLLIAHVLGLVVTTIRSLTQLPIHILGDFDVLLRRMVGLHRRARVSYLDAAYPPGLSM